MNKKNDIGFAVGRLSNLLRRDMERFHESPKKHSVRAVGGRTVHYLYDNQDKDIFQKDVENQFSIRSSTASQMLKTMEEKGLIQRVSVESDARLKKIVLTDKAKKNHEQIMHEIEEREQRLRRNISEEDLQTFFKVMQQLTVNMEDSND